MLLGNENDFSSYFFLNSNIRFFFFHLFRFASDIINQKLAGGYSIQKTVSYN